MSSNNTNKLSPQEPSLKIIALGISSNNTNKLSPQELLITMIILFLSSNNTNKLSPQELVILFCDSHSVQIIQINLVLKNLYNLGRKFHMFK